MAKRKKRKRLGTASRTNRKRTGTQRSWLSLPEGSELLKIDTEESMNIDIVPYVVKDVKKHPDGTDIPDDIWFKFPYKLHRNVGEDKKDIMCPRTIGKKCPICDEAAQIYDDPDGDDDIAGELLPSKRHAFAVRKKKGKYAILDMSDFCFFKKLSDELDDGDPEFEDYAEFEGGYTLKVRFKEKKLGTNSFPKASRIDFKQRKDIDEAELDDIPCLDDMFSFPSYDEVKAIFEGIDDDTEDNTEQSDDESNESTKEDKEETDITWDDLQEMSETDLVDCAEDYDIDLDDCDTEDETRKEIANFLDIEIPKKRKPKKEKKTKKNKKSKSKCPHDHKFGEDFEEHDECEDCEQYDACFDAYEKLDD